MTVRQRVLSSVVWSILGASGLVLALWLPAGLSAQDLASRVKAAFLYKFTSFVDWPKEAFATEDEPFRVAVYEGPSFALLLTKMTSKFGWRRFCVL